MKDRVICNAPVWALTKLISSDDGRSILDANGTGGDDDDDDNNGNNKKLQKKRKVFTDRRSCQRLDHTCQ